MRTTETMTISLPPAMAKQMKLVQTEEHRTRLELLRAAWSHYFESRLPGLFADQSRARGDTQRARRIQER